MAEHRAASQLIGDFLREVGVLVFVLWPIEYGIANHKIEDWVIVFSFLGGGISLAWGIILEGKDDL